MNNITSTEFPLDHSVTDDTIDTSTDDQWLAYVYFTASRYTKIILPPALFLLGNFGNVMTIIIMRRMSMEGTTNNIYFSAVAASDVVCLSQATLPLWLSHMLGYDVTVTHDVLCKTNLFFLILASCSSCWYLVCLTVQRAMSVVWPHRVSLMCTRRTVIVLIAAIPTSLAMFYSRYIIFRGRVPDSNGTTYYCTTIDENYATYVQLVLIYVEASFYTFIPYTLIGLSNGVLIWKLTMSVKESGRRLTQGDSEQVVAREKAANSVTLTLIVVSLSFLVLTLPNTVFYVVVAPSELFVVEGSQPGYEVARLMFFFRCLSFLRHHKLRS
ncbi:hypothetical protein ACOMHN_004470 [Nucella lapillus]